MALTASQQASRLFKKSFGAGETLTSRDFFEEHKLGRDVIFSDQIWSESSSIPTTAPSLAPGASAGVVGACCCAGVFGIVCRCCGCCGCCCC